MTLSQRMRYANVELLKIYLNNLKTQKYQLDCGHHVTFGYLIAIAILLMGLHLALSQIPGPVRRLVYSMIRIIKQMGMAVLRWCCEKLKNMFS